MPTTALRPPADIREKTGSDEKTCYITNSGTPWATDSPSPTPPSFPRARELGEGSHTQALSDTYKLAQASVNHTKTDKFSY